MPELTPVQRHARWALSRRHHGDGRWGRPDSGPGLGFYVIKTRFKRTVWARSVIGQARMVHAVRYSLVARRSGREHGRLTVWRCGGQCWTVPQFVVVGPDTRVCRKCRDAELPTAGFLEDSKA